MDWRDDITWIAVELTPLGEEKVEEGTIEAALRQDLGVDESFPVFVPATTYKKNGRTVTICLIEGYVFVASGLPEVRYFALERKAYVQTVMSVLTGPHHMRTLKALPNREVKNLQKKLRELVAADIEVGAAVKVVDGPYKGLDGRVLGSDGTDAYVEFKLRSLCRITTLPLVFLETLEP